MADSTAKITAFSVTSARSKSSKERERERENEPQKLIESAGGCLYIYACETRLRVAGRGVGREKIYSQIAEVEDFSDRKSH